MTYTTLIPTDALAAHLSGPLAIIDCRFDLQHEDRGREQYLAAHIPGAVYASLASDLSRIPSGTDGRHPLPSDEMMAATFGRLGIGPGTQVVAYDQDAGSFAGRLWWMLRYLGHDAVAVLDGGWAKWTREGRPVRSGEETRSAAGFEPQPRLGWRLRAEEVAERIGDPSVLLVDARGPERFQGTSEPLDRIAGHIPGAQNHFYKANVATDNTMLPSATLRLNFEQLMGDRTPEDVVMYCGSGVTACHNLLAMAHAGLDGAKLYPGSWSEWSSDPSRPVERGDARPRDRRSR